MPKTKATDLEKARSKYPIIPPPLPVWQGILHFFVLLFGWALFLWCVWIILSVDYEPVLYFIGAFILLCIFTLPLFTYSWILHNVNIFKKKGPRKESPQHPQEYNEDCLGTPVIANWKKIKDKRKITITVTDKGKVYSAD